MKYHIKKFFSFFRKKRVYIPALIIVAVSAWYFWSNRSANGEEIVTVESATFVQEVLATGKVVASKDVNLGFDSSGRIARINVTVGDKAATGQVLANLANGDAWASVAQRRAALDAAKAKYAQVLRGSRTEDISIAETEVEGAKTAYNQSLQALVDQIKDSYAKSDDAIRSKVDQFYTNPRSVNPEIIPFDSGSNGYSLRLSLNDQRLRAGEMLATWNKEVLALTSSSYADKNLSNAKNNLAQMSAFLNDLTTAVSSFQSGGGLSQTTIDKYKTDVSSARTAVSSAIVSLASADQSYRSSLTAYQKAEKELALKKAGSTREDIDTQAAGVKSAEADVQNAEALYAKTVIRAPFNGVITKVDVKEGEIVSPSISAISMITDSAYEIESFISEADIAKLKTGQIARITLDAYGKDVLFEAKVLHIDPAETILDGVSTYKIKLSFTSQDERIRSGMTANITIQTAEEAGAVVIPQGALFLEAGEKMVTVLQGSERIKKKVVTGGIDAGGDIQITSGLMIGEKIAVPKK